MARSVAIIGAGQIGYAAAHEFFGAGFDITIFARSKPSWIQSERIWQAYTAGEDAAPVADVVFDTIAYDEDDVARYDREKVGRYITVSSAAVYCDEQGRSFETPDLGFPEFKDPIKEDHRRLAPGPESYSTKKVRMEDKTVDVFGERATILRPSAIYGEHSRQPREWWFVKRMLDGRKRIPLANNGESRFHTTNVEMIASFAAWAAEKELSGAFNLADRNAPSVRRIGEEISDGLEKAVELVGFDGPPQRTIGASPWAIPNPFVISSEKADATGLYPCCEAYDPLISIRWLCDQHGKDWQALFPVLAGYGYDLFDYEAEDAFLASL